jgi:hypothetical protein
LQSLDQRELLLGRDPRKHRGLFDPLRKLAGRDALKHAAGADAQGFRWNRGLNRELFSDGACGERMITRDHLDLDARLLTRLHREHGFLPRRIEHALQPQKDEARTHVRMRQARIVIGFPSGKGQHTQPAGTMRHDRAVAQEAHEVGEIERRPLPPRALVAALGVGHDAARDLGEAHRDDREGVLQERRERLAGLFGQRFELARAVA